MANEFPSDLFCFEEYRLNNPDLGSFSDEQLAKHYKNYGKKEGRIISSIGTRKEFLNLLSGKTSLLEIGVFDAPSLDFLAESRDTPIIHYADYLGRDDLIFRARQIGRNPHNVPEIRWVLAEGYKQIDVNYDAVVSHHCVEHQPDLVAHLWDVKSILKSGGWYLFSVPNKNFCFDHFIQESTIVDVLTAYYLKCKKPSFKSVLEHRVFTSHVFQDGISPYDSEIPYMKNRFQTAFEEFCDNEYVDVHCWQFTPDSLRKIFKQLAAFELVPNINELKVYPAGGEFYVAIAFS